MDNLDDEAHDVHADLVVVEFKYLDLDETAFTIVVVNRLDVEFKTWVAEGKADAVPFGLVAVIFAPSHLEDDILTTEVWAWLKVTCDLEGLEVRLDKELLEPAVLKFADGNLDEDGALMRVFSV